MLHFSHPVVHPSPPVVVPPPAQAEVEMVPPAQGQAVGANGDGNGNAPAGVIMRDPWTRCGLVFRLLQAAFAAAALAVMVSTDDFSSVTTFRYLVAAASVQCLWSLVVAILDAYAIVVKRFFRTARAVIILALGDWVTGTLIFSAACGSAAITTLLSNDFGACSVNPCGSFMNATAMAFLSWLARAPAFIGNLWTAVHRIQKS
ncbi:unnamed protein product [Triticum aestivum]|uniref:CASP-like protein n=5 Tax=Triticinae TaxID=1648030 RepID=A0A9R1F0G8_WHEAT|nr:CASP-like protein 5A1 [Aegilops tauschii subsp. strangulata]XP_044329304.1 CASP-like protein 5A1 [Triticum aestivum]KAF7019561.1 hypothetical protein CFC21_032723 [Triticum aestivum]SPT20854.1 unnamed protein product [Triticum aestivum]